ncbi:RimJ/RimL family protein N-acetyltransferase [Kordia periserrulae]|uniref:RimJ/RimL family protein N-acetyltransferase n=1 Tax=Kordia periserrulae TaxID=701523 RepID=A0A2T6C208_9FLAO|nr:GNAT family N-acetyltransferase [Kordia periserrulae]PTX62362.1 RimJ/RimL family protein N-acetyltransferase [Kordia periserrulae]
MKTILETERLRLREFSLEDAEFILALVNTPAWIQYIGDRNIKTPGVAEEYIQETLQKSYAKNGFGLWLMERKEDEESIGMCGLVKRQSLEHVDIGFALLPEYGRQGYTLEAAKATLQYSKEKLKLNTIVAITDPENIASIGLLHKLGMQFDKKLQLSEDNTVLLFSE